MIKTSDKRKCKYGRCATDQLTLAVLIVNTDWHTSTIVVVDAQSDTRVTHPDPLYWIPRLPSLQSSLAARTVPRTSGEPAPHDRANPYFPICSGQCIETYTEHRVRRGMSSPP